MQTIFLKRLLIKKFPNLGNGIKLSRMLFDFKVNNLLYLYETNLGKFVIKKIYLANDFYGTERSNERLELICKLTEALREYGMQIESIKPTVNGTFLATIGKNFVRAFDYFENQGFNPADYKQFQQMIYLSKKLHDSPIEQLVNRFPEMPSLLIAPYGLSETLEQFQFLDENLSKESNEFLVVRKYLKDIFEKGLSLSDWSSKIEPVLTHMDFHPRNILWSKTKFALMIDMDYVRVGNPFSCLGLTLTRTLLYLNKEITIENILEQSSNIYLHYQPKINQTDFIANLIKGAMLCEIEKILRNLFRYYKTRKYRKYADDVTSLHFPLFLKLLKIEESLFQGS